MEEKIQTKEGFINCEKELLADYSDGRKTLIRILEEMGPVLTSSNIHIRESGVRLLTRIVTNATLFPPEVKVFCEFYADRCKDHHSMYPHIIEAYQTLLTNAQIDIQTIVASLRVFFNEIQTQSQVITDRVRVFDMLTQLIHDRKKELVSIMGSEFVLGFLQAVEGEKDPKNLKVIFSLWPLVISNFPLEPFTEDVFEALACYFPIDFHAPENLESIKLELVLGLRECLSSTGKFAPFAIPLFIEKLESDLSSAKLEALESLAVCAKKYDPHHFSQFHNDLWSILKLEILGIRQAGMDDPQLESKALTLLEIIISRLSPDGGAFIKFAVDIVWKDIKRHLNDPELKLMLSSISVVKALASVTQTSSVILSHALPHLLTVYFDSVNEKKNQILKLMGLILHACEENSSVPGKENYSSAILTSLSSSLSQDRVSAIESLAVGGIRLLVDDKKSCELILSHSISVIKFGDSTDLLPLVFSLISSKYPDIAKNSLKEVLSALEDPKTHATALPIITRLSSEKEEYFEAVVPKLLSILEKQESKEILYAFLSLINNENVGNLINSEKYGLVQKFHKLKNESDLKYRLISALADYSMDKLAQTFDEYSPMIVEAHWRGVDPNKVTLKTLPIFKSIFSEECQVKLEEGSLVEFLPIIRLRFSFLNKTQGKDIEDVVCKLLKRFEVNKNYSMVQFGWYLRALLLGSYKNISPWIRILLLRSESEDFTEPFKIISSDLTEDISEYKHLKISPVYRQKFYSLTRSSLIEGFLGSSDRKAFFLTALISQISKVPYTVISAEMPKLKPLLVGAFTSGDSSLIYASLKSCSALLLSGIENFDYEIFLPYWIQIGKSSELNNRILALECVEAVSRLPDKPGLIRLQRDTIFQLAPTLDDHKRLVRKAAVDATNSWSMLN